MSRVLTRIVAVDHQVSEFFAASDVLRVRRLLGLLTHLGDGWLWISVYLVSFLFFRRSFSSVVDPIVAAEVIGLLLVIPLRYALKRERPDKSYKAHVLTPWNQYSFPSYHSLRAFIIAQAVGMRYPSLLTALLLIAALIGFSRVYLAKHYLSDVLVGAMMGSLLGMVTVHLLS